MGRIWKSLPNPDLCAGIGARGAGGHPREALDSESKAQTQHVRGGLSCTPGIETNRASSLYQGVKDHYQIISFLNL